MPKWFVGGEMNTCYNALDVHVANGRGSAIAMHYDSPVTGTKKSITYKELHQQGTHHAALVLALSLSLCDYGAFTCTTSSCRLQSRSLRMD